MTGAAVFTPADAEAGLVINLRMATLVSSHGLKLELGAFMRRGLILSERVDIMNRDGRAWARFTFTNSNREHVAALDWWFSHDEPRLAVGSAG